MRTIRGSAFRAGLAFALVSASAAPALADGELDLGFSPPAELGSNVITALAVIGGRAYIAGQNLPVSRLRDDGSVEDAWQLASSLIQTSAIRALPSGGLAVAGIAGVTIQYDDGSFVRPVRSGIASPYSGSLLPQEDGSVTVFDADTAIKIKPDGTLDPEFRIKAQLQRSGFGSAFLQGITDSQGRYVVIGSAAPAGHSGVFRLLGDGSLDESWNPLPELQPDLSDNGVLKVFQITALPADSALLVLEKELVWINAEGHVTRRTPNLVGDLIFEPPLWQRDGKIILAGNFLHWGNVPVSGLIRLNGDGSLDPSFSVALDGASLGKMELDPEGRLWVTGRFREVNGVPRPGVARLQAYTPDPPNGYAPTSKITSGNSRVATNEVLYLTAQVDGIPTPALQWLRNGEPIANATNRGLRLNITNASEVGAFSLVASNLLGAQTLDFPPVSLAVRSPHPGTEDLSFSRALTNFSWISQLLPRTDGRVLVANAEPYPYLNQNLEVALVGRLLPDGGLDAGFGQGGVVKGRGRVETLVPLPGGGLLVTGDFTELAGQAAQGLAELDHSGNRVARLFPILDFGRVTTALPLPDGKLVIAGYFTKVGNTPAFRLARLNSDLTPDLSFRSPLVTPLVADALALDHRGRVLVAGERVASNVGLTNPPRLGLIRLLADGSADPAFHARTNGLRHIFVEPDGNLLTGMPPVRLDEDGNVLTVFDGSLYLLAAARSDGPDLGSPNHLMVRTSRGEVVYRFKSPQLPSSFADVELWRWNATGERDYAFQASIGRVPGGYPSVTAMAALPDDSLLLSVFQGGAINVQPTSEDAHRLRRIPPDSDLSLQANAVSGGQFRVSLATQPGLTYEVYRREQLTGGTATKIGEYPGDGYVVDLQTPATGNATYLELRRH